MNAPAYIGGVLQFVQVFFEKLAVFIGGIANFEGRGAGSGDF